MKQLALFASLPLLAGVVGDTLGGVVSDLIYKRTGNLKVARRAMLVIGLGGALAFMLPVVGATDPVTAVALLSASFFFLELTNAVLWSLPMDIAGAHAGTAGGMDEHRFRHCRCDLAGGVRLPDRGHRQLQAAVLGLGRPARDRCGRRALHRPEPQGRRQLTSHRHRTSLHRRHTGTFTMKVMNDETANHSAARPADDTPPTLIEALVRRARAAQRVYEHWSQEQVDMVVTAVGWAIIEPARNRELAELSVADTGIGNVDDKVLKNHRKTFGLLRDLQQVRSVGVISENAATGITEIARPVGVVCAITPSTNPGATPANKIINALKGRNAVIVAPSPKGWSTAARLLEFIHAQLDRVGAPRDLVQLLPSPITKQATAELMRQCDLVVATGSQANVRAAMRAAHRRSAWARATWPASSTKPPISIWRPTASCVRKPSTTPPVVRPRTVW